MLKIPCQHAKNRVDILPGYFPEGISARQDFHNLIHLITAESRHGYQMLRQHVQAALRRIGMLHPAPPGQFCRHAAPNALRRCTGEKIHHAHPSRIMPGAAQPLHGTGNGFRAADLKHLVDFSHINAQLHGRGGTQKAQASVTQRLLHLKTLFF